jgi:hypothetical protein
MEAPSAQPLMHSNPLRFLHFYVVLKEPHPPEKFHIHIVVRTPNGNDYGKDLLRQHLERFHRK